MEYRLDVGMWNQVFAVPCALVDRHLKLAGKEQLQVILYALRFSGQGFSPEDLAQHLGMSADLALDAIEYWCDRGLLSAAGQLLNPLPQPEGLAPAPALGAPPAALPAPAPEPPAAAQAQGEQPPASPHKPALPPKKRLLRPDSQHLTARLAESETMRFLLQEAEATLGKTLSPAMSSLLLTITDDYGLPAEVTVMLLHYAQEVGRTGTSYIDSVARDWAESGIFSLAAAEEKLQELSKNRLAWSKVSAAAGLSKRSPSKSEGQRACKWVYEWGFTDEMLSAAYDACAEYTGKFSAAYMDKVLDGWHQLGIRSLKELQENQAAQASQTSQPSRPAAPVRQNPPENKSYDITQLEQLSSFHLPENL